MGGNLFNNTQRVETTDLQQAYDEVETFLTSINVQCTDIPFLTDKFSHGDLDIIVVREDITLDNLHNIINKYPEYAINGKHVNLHQIPYDDVIEKHKNLDTISFKLGILQVDFIIISRESFQFAKHYHSYNDLGGIMGCIIKQLGYVLGREGLYYEITPHSSYGNYKVYLTKDWFKFCDTFSIDKSIYDGTNSLANVNEMFDYLCRWKYFNSEWMNPNLMNATRRNRAAKRKVFNEITQLANDVHGVYNWDTKNVTHLLSNFDVKMLDDQEVEIFKIVEKLKRKKESFSLKRMTAVLGYTPENAQHIFLSISNRFGGPNETREYMYTIDDSEFKNIIEDVMNDMK